MTKDAILKAVADWHRKRHKLACPVIGKPCIEWKCRWYIPDHAEGVMKEGAALPDLRLGGNCVLDAIYDGMTGPQAPRSGPAPDPKLIVVPPGFQMQPPRIGPN